MSWHRKHKAINRFFNRPVQQTMQLILVSTASLEEHIDADNSLVQSSYSQSQFAVTLSAQQSQEKKRLERYYLTENEKIIAASKMQLSVFFLTSCPFLNTIQLALNQHIMQLCTELKKRQGFIQSTFEVYVMRATQK